MTLEDILAACRAESEQRQNKYPLAMVQRKVEKMGLTRGFARALRKRNFSVIAEIKRKSPSMGTVNQAGLDVALQLYCSHPAVSAVSVLTQEAQFAGTPEDLKEVRKLTQSSPKPILRKDFVFSPYEVYFSRWIGADAILLMANVVEDKDEFKRLHDLAISIGLDVLCEIHDESEIAILPDTIKICGINSRRFKGVSQKKPLLRLIHEDILGTSILDTGQGKADTKTDISTFNLFDRLNAELPPGCLKIAESGISADNIGTVLEKHPFNAALIGTSLLRSSKDAMPKLLDKIQREAEAAYLRVAQNIAPKSEVSYAT